MASWDDEDFEPDKPAKVAAVRTDKWEGEDSDDDIKDAWDAESDEEKDESKANETDQPVQKKKKKKLAEKIAEKEEARLRELEEENELMEKESYKNTPEGRLAEKLRLQKLEEKNALELTKDLMGVVEPDTTSCGINFNPETAEEFTELRETLLSKFRDIETSEQYLDFVADLVSGIMPELSIPLLKKIKGEAEALTSAKLKEEKALKAKKGKSGGKATIKMETDRSMFGRGLDDYSNDMDDFM